MEMLSMELRSYNDIFLETCFSYPSILCGGVDASCLVVGVEDACCLVVSVASVGTAGWLATGDLLANVTAQVSWEVKTGACQIILNFCQVDMHCVM
eukprot:13935364-Ditylum_brightwellii.AAC.1